MLHFKNEEECHKAIADWKRFSIDGQTRNLNKAIESLELDQMYYQDKGSEKASVRCGKLLKILSKRLSEIETA